jgi:hypothetical protein
MGLPVFYLKEEHNMSMPLDRRIKCPKCGEMLKYTMWQSINTMMPFARNDIISGKLFEVKESSAPIMGEVI